MVSSVPREDARTLWLFCRNDDRLTDGVLLLHTYCFGAHEAGNNAKFRSDSMGGGCGKKHSKASFDT